MAVETGDDRSPEEERTMPQSRKLWLDTTGQPVITTAPNGERNAARWGWTPAVAVAEGYGKPSETATGTEVAPGVREADRRERKYPNKVYEGLGVAVLTGDTGLTESVEGSAEPDKPQPAVEGAKGVRYSKPLDVGLEDWWMQSAAAEIQPLAAKMREYGGNGRALDLEEIGRGLVISGVDVQGDGASVDEGYLQELGVYFYLLGKFARWTAAVAEGRRVSDDTLLDIGVYCRMAQRIRAVGGWPV